MAKGWSTPPMALIKAVEGNLVGKREEITPTVLQAVISGSLVNTGAYKANHRGGC